MRTVRAESVRSRRPLVAGGVLVGVLLGLGLLSRMMSGGDEPVETELVARPVEAKKKDLTVRRPPKRAARSEQVDEQRPAAIPVEEPVPAEAPGMAVVIVDVVDEEGRPADGAMVVPIACEGFGGGPPGEYLVTPGSCALRAVRRDGALVARGPITTVSVGGPDPAYIQLELHGRRTGGIGIRFAPSPDGMRVLDVVAGTPAYTAGLESGDLIVAVGGEPVAGMETDEFVQKMTGAEGTDVEFTVGLQSDTGVSQETLRVTRAFLEG